MPNKKTNKKTNKKKLRKTNSVDGNIYGVFNIKSRKILFVSLSEKETDDELSLGMYDEDHVIIIIPYVLPL